MKKVVPLTAFVVGAMLALSLPFFAIRHARASNEPTASNTESVAKPDKSDSVFVDRKAKAGFFNSLARYRAPAPTAGTCEGLPGGNIEVEGTGGSGTQPTGYTTIAAAFTAINNGVHTGSVTIDICGDSSEPNGGAVLNASGSGSASYTSIVISPAGGVARTISGSTTGGSPLIDLNGADNVTIDGLNASGNSLTISNASTVSAPSTIRFIADATTNTVQNCTITGSETPTSSGVVFFSTGTTTGNDGNIISGNSIGPAGTNLPTNGIYSAGTTTSTARNNSGIQITNNRIFDFFNASAASAGILISSGSTDWTITGNSLYQTASRTSTSGNTYNGISVQSGNNQVITGNFIGGSAANAGGTAWTLTNSTFANRFIGINLNVLTTAVSSVQNNTIANFAWGSNSNDSGGAFCGINIAGGNVNVGTTSGNIIGSGTGTGSVVLNQRTSGSAVLINSSNAGTVATISNNVIGSVTTTGFNATTSASIIGIQLGGSGSTLTVSGNTIGSTTTANSLNASNASTSTTAAQRVRGITTSSTGTVSITNNTIANLNNAYGTAPSTPVTTMLGIEATSTAASGANTITGNTIQNLTNANPGTDGVGNASVIGILMNFPNSAGQTISQNTIHSLSDTAAAGVTLTGIYYQGPTSGSNLVARNFIHSLSATNSAATINGIKVNSGTTTYQNNMIRLGINAAGSSITTGLSINGISESGTANTNNFYFNSVFIGGTGVLTTSNKTFAFSGANTTNPRIHEDNIFVNARSNATTGSTNHYAISVGGTGPNPTGLTINYNVYSVTGTGGKFGLYNTADVNTFADWRTAVGQDLNSFNSDPQFLTPNGTSATVDLHINPSISTVVEGNGLDIAAVTDDFDGETRSTLTPVDIGADAGNFTGSDVALPSISYTPLTNTSSTSNRSFTGVTITDASGINTSPGTKPRVYYKKTTDANTFVDNTNATNGWKFVEANGATSPFDFTIDYSRVFGGSVSAGNIVQYFVVAQDLAPTPNVGINSGTFAAIPSSVALTSAAFPIGGTVRSYNILIQYSGVINVGSGETITSLTNLGGLFDKLNAGVVIGDLTINITSNLTGESGTVALNQWIEEGVGNYSLTLKPSGGARSITSTGTANSLIKLNGADRVTIDGSTSGGTDRSLTITNANTANGTGAIFIGSLGAGAGATNNTIKNCIIHAGSIGDLSNSTYGISAGSGAVPGPDNDDLVIQNNQINLTTTGIQVIADAVNVNNNLQIIDNLIGDNTLANSIGRIGMIVQQASGATISGNTVKNIFLTGNSSPVGVNVAGLTSSTITQNNINGVQANGIDTSLTLTGLRAASLTDVTISQNTIDGVQNTVEGTPFGIILAGGFTNSSVMRNIVTNISYNGTDGFGGKGIDINTVTGSNFTVANNVISNIKGDGWNDLTTDSIVGIRILGSTGGVNLYFNSVNLGSGSFAGNVSGTLSAALYVGSSTTALDIRDNIFATNLDNTGAAGDKTYAVYSDAANTAFTTIDYNNYFASGAAGVLGFLASDQASISAWRTASGQDVNSFPGKPEFTSATNLHINPPASGTSPVSNTGTAIGGITTDYDGDTRNATTPDVGADEFSVNFSSSGSTSLGPGGYDSITINSPDVVTLSGNASSTGCVIVNSGGTLNFGAFILSGPGCFALNSGGTIGIGDPNGITSGTTASGNIQLTGGRTYSTGANYNYTGSIAQVTGNGLPASVNNLTISNSAGVSLSQDVAVNGVLTLNNDLTTTTAFVLTENGTSGGTGDVVGTVRRTDLGGAAQRDFGNPNVEITIVSGDITAMDVNFQKGAPGGFASAVQRFYSLEPVTGSVVTDATVKLHYRNSELQANDPSTLTLWRAAPSDTWTDQGTTGITRQTGSDPDNWVQKTGVTAFSPWTLASAPQAPTAVKLVGFTARENNGEVMLQWRSGYEARNLGYNIYREQDGQRVAITPSLVAGSALIAGRQTRLTAGASYTWYDDLRQQAGSNPESENPNTKSAVTYWLEDVDLDGTRTLHGPIAVSGDTSGQTDRKALRAQLISEVSQRTGPSGVQFNGWAADSSEPAGRQTAAEMKAANASVSGATIDPIDMQHQIAGMAGAKIGISKAGWYRVTQPELQAAGFKVGNVGNLQMFRNGRELPISVSGNGQGFGAADYVEFYGEDLESPTETAQTYYLVNGSTRGKRLSITKGGKVSAPAGPQSFAYTIERKERMIYFSSLRNGDAENFFGQIVSTTPVSAAVPVSHLDGASGGAQLQVVLQGVTSQSHLVHVLINGTDLGTVNFANLEHPNQTFAVPAAALHNGDNVVELTSLGGAADVSLVDVLRLTYTRSLIADNDGLSLSVNSQQTRRISGFSNQNVRVLDITDSNNTTELTPMVKAEDGGYAAYVEVGQASTLAPHSLLAFAAAGAQASSVKANNPSSWWSQTTGADYLIITTGDLKTSVEPLAQLRRNQGLVVKVIDVEDLYDEFSFGAHTPQAIHELLQTAQNSWTRKPHYVLLAGDASYDPKNYFGQGLNDLVPTKLIDTALMETASDDWLADFNGDGLADLAMGRLPVRTAADTNTMVGKIISYENMTIDPTRGALLVADTGFEGESSAVQSLLPAGTTVTTINRSSADDATIRNQIITGLNQGPRVTNYVGHGSNGVWTGESLFSSEDAPGLTNTNRLSVFTLMTCFNGFFQDAWNDSLSEALLKSQGGAVAVWASTTLTEPEGQNAIDQEFYRQLFGAQRATLGDASRAAKLVTTDADVSRTWTLFGDPAMRLK